MEKLEVAQNIKQNQEIPSIEEFAFSDEEFSLFSNYLNGKNIDSRRYYELLNKDPGKVRADLFDLVCIQFFPVTFIQCFDSCTWFRICNFSLSIL